MPDRYALPLRAAVASNFGGPFATTWAQVVVPSDGTIRRAWVGATSVTSNARQSRADIYNQPDAPAFGSNTGTSVLTGPVTIANDGDYVEGTVSEAGVRVVAGSRLQLRIDANTSGAAAAFTDLNATVEIERD